MIEQSIIKSSFSDARISLPTRGLSEELLLGVLEESSSRLSYLEEKLQENLGKGKLDSPDRDVLRADLNKLVDAGLVRKTDSENEREPVFSLSDQGIRCFHREYNHIPALSILEVFYHSRRASLLYLEGELAKDITSANKNNDSDRDFLKRELLRLSDKGLIKEIESHSDALRAYFLTAKGLEEYRYRQARPADQRTRVLLSV